MNLPEIKRRLLDRIEEADDAMLVLYFKIIVGDRLEEEELPEPAAPEAANEILDRYDALR